ncbi:MAG: hypothetical protein H0X45_12430 [Planctomycetes bacterium]|nr:hypothetical protein [Planctomycetota bacterium]
MSTVPVQTLRIGDIIRDERIARVVTSVQRMSHCTFIKSRPLEAKRDDRLVCIGYHNGHLVEVIERRDDRSEASHARNCGEGPAEEDSFFNLMALES